MRTGILTAQNSTGYFGKIIYSLSVLRQGESLSIRTVGDLAEGGGKGTPPSTISPGGESAGSNPNEAKDAAGVASCQEKFSPKPPRIITLRLSLFRWKINQ